MSRLRRDMYRRKLREKLGLMPDADFFLLCWATHALQTGRVHRVANWFQYPPQAAVQDLSATYAVYPWVLETLLNESLALPKDRRGRRLINMRTFDLMPPLFNALTRLENAEDGLMLGRMDVRNTFHLIAQRQFEWQRGVWSRPHMYRSSFVYAGPETKEHFQRARGIPLDDFTLAAFLLRGIFLEHPSTQRAQNLEPYGLPPETLRAVLDLISLPIRDARNQAREIRRGYAHTAYKKSLFRTHPCVEFEEGIVICPLPDLITRRGTTGIFYDVIDGPDGVKNEIAYRFEGYCRDFLNAMLPNLRVSGDYKYQIRKGFGFDTPDVLVREQDALCVIVECKATRMSYEARFSEDPVAADPRGYGEIARGIFQIWRFASHVRRGFVTGEHLAPGVRGVVVTLDNWLPMGEGMIRSIFDRAEAIVAQKDPDIAAQDRIPVIFCPIEELEQTLATSSADTFLTITREACSEKYRGWMLSAVQRQMFPNAIDRNEYPFADRLSEVLPWWDRFGRRST